MQRKVKQTGKQGYACALRARYQGLCLSTPKTINSMSRRKGRMCFIEKWAFLEYLFLPCFCVHCSPCSQCIGFRLYFYILMLTLKRVHGKENLNFFSRVLPYSMITIPDGQAILKQTDMLFLKLCFPPVTMVTVVLFYVSIESRDQCHSLVQCHRQFLDNDYYFFPLAVSVNHCLQQNNNKTLKQKQHKIKKSKSSTSIPLYPWWREENGFISLFNCVCYKCLRGPRC